MYYIDTYINLFYVWTGVNENRDSYAFQMKSFIKIVDN